MSNRYKQLTEREEIQELSKKEDKTIQLNTAELDQELEEIHQVITQEQPTAEDIIPAMQDELVCSDPQSTGHPSNYYQFAN